MTGDGGEAVVGAVVAEPPKVTCARGGAGVPMGGTLYGRVGHSHFAFAAGGSGGGGAGSCTPPTVPGAYFAHAGGVSG